LFIIKLDIFAASDIAFELLLLFKLLLLLLFELLLFELLLFELLSSFLLNDDYMVFLNGKIVVQF
jgi:hypothetical protein